MQVQLLTLFNICKGKFGAWKVFAVGWIFSLKLVKGYFFCVGW